MENRRNIRQSVLFGGFGENEYQKVLGIVQKGVAFDLKKEIENVSEKELMDKIYTYIAENGIKCSLTEDPLELAKYIYHDMAGYGFITREKIFDIPGFEELNVNAWNNIHIKINGKTERTNYSFLSPEHAIDIHKKMLRVKNVVIDNAEPRAIADVGGNIRICCSIAPIVDKNIGIASSIRKVSLMTIDLPKLMSSQTLTKDMADFLIMCLRFGASICVSGETGSGKTTTLGGLLSAAAKRMRMTTIEEGSREWNFIEHDKDGKPISDVVHKLTRPHENPKQNFDQEFLIKDALREDPDIIGMGEIRGREAFETMGVANTGHTIATTVHSNGAEDTPERVVTLAKKAYDMEDATLYSMFARAFPILVHQEKLADGKRKVTQIYEVIGYTGGEMQYNPIYEYEVIENKYDNYDKITETVGEFRQTSSISKKLSQKLLKRGAKVEELKRFYYEVKE